MDQIHHQIVADISEQVRGFYERKQPFHVFHGSTNSTRILSFDRQKMVDVSSLNRVVRVNKAKRTAIVETNVPMDQLVEQTLKHGLLPPVVMEFPGITVGGGIQGGAGESSSYRWGCFNEICNWYEMILGSGEVIRVSPQEHADLFYGTAGSYGSLGIITAAEIQLIPAKPYVNLDYRPVSSFMQAVKVLQDTTADSRIDYIDGIMFSATSGVIITGTLSDTPSGQIATFTRRHDPWFYLHAQKFITTPHQESVPVIDYLFRYDRGAFWMGRHAFQRLHTPFNTFTRWLLDSLMHTRKMYQALQASAVSQQHIVQDLALPLSRAVDFMKFVDTTTGIYPLWLCPLKVTTSSPLQSNNLDTPLIINIGVWGPVMPDYDEFVSATRAIETTVRKLGGKKWFYAHSYYSEQEFWGIYDKKWYDNLRRKYHATRLPNMYDKIVVKQRYPVSVKHGALKTMLGRARLSVKD